MEITPYRILLFFAKSWTLLAIIVIIYTALTMPRPAESTDYVMTFYVAGHLAASGRAADLYPEPNALSFTGSPFDKAAHALLSNLPKNHTAAYMYSPLVAWFFSPLSYLRPNLSLLLWQGISLAALALSCCLLSRLGQINASNTFFLSFLLFPVFITLWIGQLGIVFGILPLCVGFLLLMKDRPFLAGVAWSFLSLKPQYLPTVGVIGAGLALAGRVHCLAGIILGSAGLFLANLLLFPREITLNWLNSFRASDATYSSEFYAVPIRLITSLPSNLLMLFPVGQRPSLKLPIYFLATALWLIGLWQCRKLARVNLNQPSKITLMGVVGVGLLPLVPPHMLYYDLCLFLPAGAALLGRWWPMPEGLTLRRFAVIAWLSTSLYFPLLLSVNASAALPLTLVSVLLGSFVAILTATNKISLGPRLWP